MTNKEFEQLPREVKIKLFEAAKEKAATCSNK